MVIWVAGTMFKDLGHSDSEITVATASVGIAWSLKPFWAGFLDMFKTKKFFVLSTEFVMGALFALMGAALQLPGYFAAIIAIMWIAAFASATQDICSDGIYISSLNTEEQAKYIGVQGMAWNLGRIIAVSVIVWLAGTMQQEMGFSPKVAWMYALFAAGGLMSLFGFWHMAVLPTGSLPNDKTEKSARAVFKEFAQSASDFCNKRVLWGMLAFVFFYRSGEGLLLIEAPLFLQGCLEDGGLQLSLAQKGQIDGIFSTIAGILGGLLGGAFIARYSLKRSLFVLALCVNVPNLCYVYLSQVVTPEDPLSFMHIASVVSIEKFWYGFGFVGNMLYMMQQIAPGKFKMTHYAFATAFMNLVLVPTQMASGPMADNLGFKPYFWVVIIACVPSLIAAWFAPFPQLKAKSSNLSVDDPSLLSADQLKMQAAAKGANIYALLAIAAFLFVDVLALGFLSGAKSGILVAFLLGLMAITTLLKLILAVKALTLARAAIRLSEGLKEVGAYLANARGARIGAVIMLLVALVHSGWTLQKAQRIEWDCAFGDEAAACLQPHEEAPKQCKVEYVKR